MAGVPQRGQQAPPPGVPSGEHLQSTLTFMLASSISAASLVYELSCSNCAFNES